MAAGQSKSMHENVTPISRAPIRHQSKSNLHEISRQKSIKNESFEKLAPEQIDMVAV